MSSDHQGRPSEGNAVLQPPRGLTFGSAAELYERYRPGYPQEVVDLVLRTESRPVATAIEIGAGTGKATRSIAAHGVAVTAVEPDPLMREVLARVTAGLPVTVVGCTLETLPLEGTTPVDLLYAAAAWHWTDPQTRWERAARLLVEGGTFASFGGPMDLADPELAAQVSAVRSEFMERDDLPQPGGGPSVSHLKWPGTELLESPWFTDVEEHELPSTSTMAADDFVGLLATVSAYLVLPESDRLPLLARIRATMPDDLEVRRDLVVHRARRTAKPVAPLIAPHTMDA